jgi:hypothetical protein
LAASIRLSEIMADPAAVSDTIGEYIELANEGATAINLRGWTLIDGAGRSHTITADLWIAPGAYLVLTRGDAASLAGYAHSDYQFMLLQLANTNGGVTLYAPGSTDGTTPVDAIRWGAGAGLTVKAGVSFERPDLAADGWTLATTPWNAAHTDKGSPGVAFSGAPTPTPAPTATVESSATPTFTATPLILLPTPTPTPTFTATPLAGPAPRLRLSEIMPDPLAVNDVIGEFIELTNLDPQPVDLRGWTLLDGGGRSHTIATELWIAPGAYLVLTHGDAALAGYAHSDYQFAALQLANTNGALSLFAPGNVDGVAAVDAVVWGTGAGLAVHAGASFERPDPAADGWVLAATPWSTTHTDKGSPGAAFGSVAPPTATPTPALITPTATPTSPPILLPTPTPTPTATPTAGPAPRLLLSEIMVDPQAIDDTAGEFVEVTNADTVDANLRGWSLVDGAGRTHVIAADLWIAPGAYLVLTRGDAATLAGYVRSDYHYSAVQLANTAGTLSLRSPGSAPDAPPADSIVWGESLRPQAGASFERADLAAGAWVVAAAPWTDAHADKGSPGAAFAGGVLPTPSPEATSTPLPLPAAWLPNGAASSLQIDEVYFQGSDGEFIALTNLGAETLSLGGWLLGDAETPGKGEGIYRLPESATLASGAVYVVARNAANFRQTYGRLPDAEWEASDAGVPDLQRETRFGGGRLALDDGGDEVVLLDAAGVLFDAVAYKAGEYASLALAGNLAPPTGLSLQRVPGADFASVRDVRHRFLAAPPRPFERRGLPLPAWREPVTLGAGFTAVWGTLGGASSFTSGYTAPPHYLLAEAAAQGFDFLAIADVAPVQPLQTPASFTALAAWRWHDGDNALIVYDNTPPVELSIPNILAHLASAGSPWQNLGSAEHFAAASLIAAAESAPPASLADWFAAWQSNAAPALPAGNSNPDLPGVPQLQPRYTGLAVVSTDATGVHEALRARRGWVTTAPGLRLTLQAELASGQLVWMGQRLAPANQVTLHIGYSDRSGELAGLAIWQDGRPLRQLDLPTADGRWTVTIPAVPGAILTAVATQFDGDFAVTAPFFVEAGEMGTLLLNEVLPAPRNDYSGDGAVDGEDEYIELYNPGALPVPLAGWTLLDGDDAATAHHTTFGAGRYLGGGERLLLLHKAHHLSLRNDAGVVRLLDPGGVERDRVAWDAGLTRGRSVARIPDGGVWVWSADATPGAANANTGVNVFAPWPEAPPPAPSNNPPPPNPAVEATAGQMGGPPGSIAQAKLDGLGAWVEFRAVVVAPPGLFNSSIYVADVTGDGATAGIGVNVYLRRGEYPALEAGDLVLLRGRLDSFRGETELVLDTPDQIWRIEGGALLQPLVVRAGVVGEALEGRLVTFRGVVTGWQGDSIFLGDPDDPAAEPVRVTVRTTLAWKRPYVKVGEVWVATGVVSQFARAVEWRLSDSGALAKRSGEGGLIDRCCGETETRIFGGCVPEGVERSSKSWFLLSSEFYRACIARVKRWSPTKRR